MMSRKSSDNESAASWTMELKSLQEQAKIKAKKLLTAAACMAVICAVGFTAGAAVKEYLYKNTVRLQKSWTVQILKQQRTIQQKMR